MSDQSIPAPKDAAAQIARLREQVELLMREHVSPVVAGAADRAETAISAVQEQAEALSDRVRKRPITAVLVALAVGLAIGRLLR